MEGIINGNKKISNYPIDLDALKERVMGDMTFLSELLTAFGESIPGILALLRRFLEGYDGPALSRTAHQLKGAALNLGFVGIAEQATALDESGRLGDYEKASKALEALRHSVSEAEKYLHQEMHHVSFRGESGNENTHSG